MKKKTKQVQHAIIGQHNGIDVTVLTGSKNFMALGVRDKIGCPVEASSFQALTKKLDKLSLRNDALHPTLKGRYVAVLSRVTDCIDGVGVLTGRTKTEWLPSYGGGYRARHVLKVEIEVGGEIKWADCEQVVTSSRKRLLRTLKNDKATRKAVNRAEALEKRNERALKALPRLKLAFRKTAVP